MDEAKAMVLLQSYVRARYPVIYVVSPEEVRVERDGGLPSAFELRGKRYEVRDVIGKWRIEGRWWADGRDREYWRVEARGGAVWDLYFDRQRDAWHMERLWD